MNRLVKCAAICVAASAVFASAAYAQPAITALQNNYSYMLPGTPNYALAQGSIVVIYGANMAPAGLLQQGFDPALEKTLGGVSIRFNVGGAITEGIPYYVSPTQIGAILPSSTPVGNGTITVSYGGQTSAPFNISVAQGAFGILTMGGNGIGQAAVFDTGYQYITATNAANPNQTVTFWGTGLGPDSRDETRLLTGVQEVNAPFQMYIGGKVATVDYHGRSSYPGLDQINVTIPAGVEGCYVSVYAKSGNYISNFTTIPVAATGKVCSQPTTSSTDLPGLLSKQAVNSAWLGLSKSTATTPDMNIGGVTIPGGTTTSDRASATFIRYTPASFIYYGGLGSVSAGSCLVSVFSVNSPFTPPAMQYLDAGSLSLRLPDGSTKQMTKGTSGDFSLSGSASTPTNPLFIPAGGGTFRFTGTGGADVGAFTADITASTPITWTNKTGVSNISRSQNLNVTWSGGADNSLVVISGMSATETVLTSFTCTERKEAGQFTVPADVLGALVPSVSLPGLSTGQLSVSNQGTPVKFTAAGVDNGNVGFATSDSANVNYQ